MLEKEKIGKCVIAYFVEGKGKKSAGLELVALSRSEEAKDLFIGNKKQNLTTEMLTKIGKSSESEKRHVFEDKLKQIAPQTQKPFVEAITDLDVSKE